MNQNPFLPFVVSTPDPEAQPASLTDRETFQKSIAAQVFLNHFFGWAYHLRQGNFAEDLGSLRAFQQFQPRWQPDGAEARIRQMRELLENAWKTEYALRRTAEVPDEAFLRNALHWTFPQAYYSVLFSLRALLVARQVTTNNPTLIRGEAGRLAAGRFYPDRAGFYASGHYPEFKLHRLPRAGAKPSLLPATTVFESQSQIAQFLRTTRTLQAKAARQQVQANAKLALRHPKTGQVLERFTRKDWEKLTPRLGYTSYFDLMTRLRVSSQYREVERFMEADINFELFHQSLLEIVSYTNAVHESYVAKVMGLEQYEAWVAGLPGYLREFVQVRLREKVEPALQRAEGTPYESRLAA
jgi:plasmid stabilization system protein ParE